MDEAAKLTGYSVGRLHCLRHAGRFLEPTRVIGTMLFFEPRAVKRWHREYVASRSPRGAASPIPK
jgi:hypothetical protein